MTNNFLKGSALGALAAALGLTALPAAAAPTVDFDAPMTAIDVGTGNDDAKLAQDRTLVMPLLGQRGHVLAFAAREHHAAKSLEFANDRLFRRSSRLGQIGQSHGDVGQ